MIIAYKQAVDEEVYPENPDGESLAMIEMLNELRSMDCGINSFVDIRYHSFKSPEIMRVFLKYYDRMESYYTKQILLERIDPKRFPQTIPYALELYEQYTPFERMDMTGLQRTLARGKMTKEHIDLLYSLIKDPDGYASGDEIKEKLCKVIPEEMKKLTYRYCDGVLLLTSLNDFYIFRDEQSIKMLEKCASITNEQLIALRKSHNYDLNISLYEYYSKLLADDEIIKYRAKDYLRKLRKKSI